MDASGAAGGSRPRRAAVSRGDAELHALHDQRVHTVGNRIKPPFTVIVKYDLNVPAIKWRIPFGDDPALAARGITGTGSPAINSGVIVTESGLVFGAGKDNHIRAWDSDTGALLWSSRFGGNFQGSPVSYVMNGRQVLVAAASSAGGRGFGPAPAAAAVGPMGWVAYCSPAIARSFQL